MDALTWLCTTTARAARSRTVKLLVKKNKLVGGDGSDTPALSDKSRNTLSRAAAAARKRVQSRHAEAASGAEGETEVPGDSETVPLWREGTEKTQSGREMEAEAESKEEGVKVAPESKVRASPRQRLCGGAPWCGVDLQRSAVACLV